MKKLVAALATAFFVTGINAADIYHVLGDGNSDLSTRRFSAEDFVGVQPSIGDSVDRYQGWADGNPDLFKVDRGTMTNSGDDPNIYMSISGNPDLQF